MSASPSSNFLPFLLQLRFQISSLQNDISSLRLELASQSCIPEKLSTLNTLIFHSQTCKPHCKSVPAQSQIWHTSWQSCLNWRTISHMWSIFCFTCVKYASSFFWHMMCQIRLKWSQQRIIVKHIWHNMCQMWLCAGARFTVQI
jgi:hypothetical protein